MSYIEEMFSLEGRRIVVMGGAGVIPVEIELRPCRSNPSRVSSTP